MTRYSLLRACVGLVSASALFAGCSAGSDSGSPDDANRPDAAIDAAVGPSADAGDQPDSADGDAALDSGTLADAEADSAADAALPDATVLDGGVLDATIGDGGQADALAQDGGSPNPSRVCTSTNDFEERSCGMCGTQSRICLPQANGSLDWASWSYCNGQRDGGCVPGVETDGGVSCGNRCGRARAVCQNDCTFAQGSCIVPAGAVCEKGVSAWQSDAGCADAGEGRRHTCLDDCTWGAWSECGVEYPPLDGGGSTASDMVVPAVGQTATLARTLSASATMGRVPTSYLTPTTCPLTGTFSSVSTSYVYTSISNATGAPRTVAIWASAVGGGTVIDTVMAVYPVPVGPLVEAQRRVCVGVTNDDCESNADGCDSGSGFSGLHGANAIVIPPGAVYSVLVQSYFSSDVGAFALNVKALN